MNPVPQRKSSAKSNTKIPNSIETSITLPNSSRRIASQTHVTIRTNTQETPTQEKSQMSVAPKRRYTDYRNPSVIHSPRRILRLSLHPSIAASHVMAKSIPAQPWPSIPYPCLFVFQTLGRSCSRRLIWGAMVRCGGGWGEMGESET